MSSLPLISCLCPTARRGAFLAQSVAYFQAQDYPNKELIILEDGGQMHAHSGKGIIYHYSVGDLSIGTKRNLATALAHGDILTHWDDDDYYGPGRLLLQVDPLLRGEAEVSALRMELLFDVAHWHMARCPKKLHARLFAHDVRSSTLMYWAEHGAPARYQEVSAAEDSGFLESLLTAGQRLSPLTLPYQYISVQHATNTSAALDMTNWERVAPVTYLSRDELLFYRQFRAT